MQLLFWDIFYEINKYTFINIYAIVYKLLNIKTIIYISVFRREIDSV